MSKLKPFNKIKTIDEKHIKQERMEQQNGRLSSSILLEDTCCAVCGIGRDETKLKKCSLCGLVVYCSTSCQTTDCKIISLPLSYLILIKYYY